jgi:hypothetical protein
MRRSAQVAYIMIINQHIIFNVLMYEKLVKNVESSLSELFIDVRHGDGRKDRAGMTERKGRGN